jgi:3alpha(or 20beta)-hydroxysteroid dehydrogenase
VHPGLINTPMLHEVFGSNSDATIEAIGSRVPNGRMATADDVAKLVLYLASDDSAYSTGSEFVVDGGMTARLG